MTLWNDILRCLHGLKARVVILRFFLSFMAAAGCGYLCCVRTLADNSLYKNPTLRGHGMWSRVRESVKFRLWWWYS